MANPLQLAWQNYVDAEAGGSVTASSTAAGLPATNLQLPDVRLLWRANSGLADLVADLGSVRTVSALALIRTNMSGSDTIRVRMSATDPNVFTSLSHDSGVLAPAISTTYRRWIYFTTGTSPTARYVRLTLSQASPCEAGRLVISFRWNPSRTFAFGWEPTWRDPSRQIESLGQTTFVDTKESQRGFRFRLVGLTTAEAENELIDINRRNGTKRDILVCKSRDSTNLGRDTIWGLLGQPVRFTQTEADFWEAEFEVWDRDRL